VEGNPKWFVELALKLELLKVFDALPRSLDLRELRRIQDDDKM
jgi:hypothetical protein